MSSASAQGVIRYSVMVEDKSTATITKINNEFKNMGTQITALDTKMKTFNTAINNNSRSFNATIQPIKQQGSALTSLANNLKAVQTQAVSVGTKIKDAASKFSGFATGLSATTTGILQLNAGFRDYGDAQIAVDKAQRKLSLSQEALNKATDKLQALQNKGIHSGKEFAQAQLDVKQAQDGLAIATQLVGERQEDMFDAQSNFVASVIPTTLGAVGTLGAAFKELGGTKGLGGLVEKFKAFGGAGGLGGLGDKLRSFGGAGGLGGLGDKFKGIGTAVASIIPSLTGIGTKSGDAIKGIAGIGTASTTAAGGVGALKAALSGVGLALGTLVGIPLTGILAAGAIQKIFPKETAEQVALTRLEYLKLAEALGASPEQIKAINDSLNTLNKNLGLSTVEFGKTTKAAENLNKIAAAEKKLSDDEDALAAKKQERQTTSVKKEVEHMEAVVASDKAEIARLKTMAKTVQAQEQVTQSAGTMNDTITESTNIYGVWADTAAPAIVTVAELIDNKLKGSFTPMNDTLTESTDIFGVWHDVAVPAIVTVGKTTQKTTEFFKLFGDANILAADAQKEIAARLDETNAGMDSLNAAIQAGTTKFSDFVSQSELGAVTNKKYTDSLRQWVSSQIEINPALDLTTSQLEALQTALAKGQVDMAGVSDATKILADAFNEELAPAMKTFDSVIKADKWKDFKKALKDLPGFGDFSKGAKKEFSGLLNDMRHVADIAKEVGTDISAGILGAFEGVSEKSLGSVIKNLTKDIKEMSKIDIDATKFKPITDFLNNAPNKAEAFKKLNDTLALMQDAMSDGKITGEEAAAVMAKFAEETGKTVDPANKSAAAVKAFGVSSASARGQIDQVTGAIDVLKGQAEAIKPVIKVDTDPALGSIGELKRAWDKVAGQIEKKIPKINANSDKALDVIGELKRAWDKTAAQIEKKIPKLTVNADQALDMIGEVHRGIDSLKDKTVTITEKHVEIAQGGMHKILAHDTTILAHRGEEVDIWPAAHAGIKGTGKAHGHGDVRAEPIGSMRSFGSGRSGTDVVNLSFRLEGNDMINTREFKRQIKRESGTNLWQNGA